MFSLIFLHQEKIELIDKPLEILNAFFLQQLAQSTPKWFTATYTSDSLSGQESNSQGVFINKIFDPRIQGDLRAHQSPNLIP
jgi:hypothetical protein